MLYPGWGDWRSRFLSARAVNELAEAVVGLVIRKIVSAQGETPRL